MKRAWWLHPILFSAYSALAQLAVTVNSPLLGGRMLAVSLLAGLLLLLVGWAVAREGHRAGFLASLCSFLLLGYGHVYSSVQGARIGPFVWGRHEVLFALWASLIILLGSRWTWNRLRNPQVLTLIMNVAAVAAMVLPAVKLGWYLGWTVVDAARLEGKQLTVDPASLRLGGTSRPDIYYIILDGYGREDILRESYGFDNREFTSYLEARGFVVADQAQANYSQTTLSLASALNLGYLDTLASVLGPDSRDREPFVELIGESVVIDSLERLGYETVGFASGIYFTELGNADLYLSPFRWNLNDMEGLWLSTTATALLKDPQGFGLPLPSYDSRRRMTEFTFEQLGQVGSRPGPQFVFAHIVAPHPPFVFDAAGRAIDPPWAYKPDDGDRCCGTVHDYQLGYIQQLRFVNARMEAILDAILEQAESPPVILIQGDHGPGALLDVNDINRSCLRERIPILSAYYLPPGERDRIYSTITPVNSFRVVLNSVFDAGLELLPDRSYYSTWNWPYDLVDVGDRVGQQCDWQADSEATP